MMLGCVLVTFLLECHKALILSRQRGDVRRVCCLLPWDATAESLFCGDGGVLHLDRASYLIWSSVTSLRYTLGAATFTQSNDCERSAWPCRPLCGTSGREAAAMQKITGGVGDLTRRWWGAACSSAAGNWEVHVSPGTPHLENLSTHSFCCTLEHV